MSWSDFARSFFCLWTSLRGNLSEDRENYDQSQTKTWKSTKKTVKTTIKVRQNYELGGQKKLKKPKFLENGGFLWKIKHSGVNEIYFFIYMWIFLLHQCSLLMIKFKFKFKVHGFLFQLCFGHCLFKDFCWTIISQAQCPLRQRSR